MIVYPTDFTHPYTKLRRAYLAAARIAELATEHRAVVQAGGCAGLWPLALSAYFDRVYTFEPEPSNFACLHANIAAVPTITAYPYALGAHTRHVGLTRPKAQAGLWRVDGDGDIPMVRLDDVLDGPIDALVLDVEGSELAAWHGAARLITASHPLLWFEYLDHPEAIDRCLDAHGYAPPLPGMGGDGYSLYTPLKESYAQDRRSDDSRDRAVRTGGGDRGATAEA